MSKPISKFIINPYAMRVARRMQKKSIAYVANYINRDPETVTKYEYGDISINLKTFVRFSEAIKMHPVSLFKLYLGINYDTRIDLSKKILNVKKRKEILSRYVSTYVKGKAFKQLLDDMIADDDILLGSNDKVL